MQFAYFKEEKAKKVHGDCGLKRTGQSHIMKMSKELAFDGKGIAPQGGAEKEAFQMKLMNWLKRGFASQASIVMPGEPWAIIEHE